MGIGVDGRRVGGRPHVLLAVEVDVFDGNLPGEGPVEVWYAAAAMRGGRPR